MLIAHHLVIVWWLATLVDPGLALSVSFPAQQCNEAQRGEDQRHVQEEVASEYELVLAQARIDGVVVVVVVGLAEDARQVGQVEECGGDHKVVLLADCTDQAEEAEDDAKVDQHVGAIDVVALG